MSEKFGGGGPEKPKFQEEVSLDVLMEAHASSIESFRRVRYTFIELYDLDRLRSIVDIPPEGSEEFRLREMAKRDIVWLTSVLQRIEHSLPREQWLVLWNGLLKQEYLPISMAVGIINSGRIRHE